MPIFLITCGATGSGKANLPITVFQYIGERRKFYSFLVDDLVEKDKKYKEKVNQIIREFECQYPFIDRCDLTDPSQELLDAFRDAYFAVRNARGCDRNRKHFNCNELIDNRIAQMMLKRKNIVLETTGSYLPTWIFSLPNIDDYDVVVAYTIVSFDNLLLRNKMRSQKSMAKYLKDETGPAPRVIDISTKTFKPIVKNIRDTLVGLRNNCLKKDETDDECRTMKRIHNLLIFDNNEKMRLIYDHSQDYKMGLKRFTELINRSFGM